MPSREADESGGMPSGKEWNDELQRSRKALLEALAMPNETLPELLIQGAELVSAIGQRALLFLGDLSEPEPGFVYEDEIEARAAMDTFKRSCHKTLTAFSEVDRFLDERASS